jgi:rhodanese-related sulfurtransferase
MEQLTEFIGANLIWVCLWLALAALLLWNSFGHIIQGIVQIEPMEATRLVNHQHAVIIDIRSPADFANGHILDAVNITDADIRDKKQDLEKYRKKPLIVCCQTGTTSQAVVRLLKADGFPAVFMLRGGLTIWQRAGLPLVRSMEQGKKVTGS